MGIGILAGQIFGKCDSTKMTTQLEEETAGALEGRVGLQALHFEPP